MLKKVAIVSVSQTWLSVRTLRGTISFDPSAEVVVSLEILSQSFIKRAQIKKLYKRTRFIWNLIVQIN